MEMYRFKEHVVLLLTEDFEEFLADLEFAGRITGDEVLHIHPS
jgi:hypothetical protein